MIVTPEQLIKQYFPEPIETTRELYERLELEGFGYPYLNWLKDAEEHCLIKFVNEVDYKLLPGSEKNFWISQKVFWTLIQVSPSKICDEIRAGLLDISRKVATDPAFAKQLRDQLDQESGVEKVIPKVSKKLKAKYNETGQDAFEFSIKADTRLYVDIISGYNFLPGQKINNVFIFFKLEVENGVPYHIVDIALSLTDGDTFSYRTIWCCSEERQRYGAILENRVIRFNLFKENRKLVDSYEYILGSSDIKTLEIELEKIISMLLDVNLEEINLDQLGEKILYRYNLNEQAYIRAIEEVKPTQSEYGAKASAEINTAFAEVVNQYWDYYVLQPDPTKNFIDDMEQMVKDRIPRVNMAYIVAHILYNRELCDSYFKRSYSSKQVQALLNDSNLRLIYALAETADFDPAADSAKRIEDMCVFIIEHLDFMKKIFVEMGQWPSN